MPEQGIPEGAVSREHIADLAVLFDQFEYSFDPLSLEARHAESQFEDKILLLFRERVAPKYLSVTLSDFRARIRSLCRIYLRKNPPR